MVLYNPPLRAAPRLIPAVRPAGGEGVAPEPLRNPGGERPTPAPDRTLDGGDLYLAWTTLDDLAGQDVLI